MTRTGIVLTNLCLLLVLSGCSNSRTANNPVGSTPEQPETKRIASADVVKAAPQPTQISAGGSGESIVRLTIDDGYHINANPPTYPYLIATRLEMPPTEGVSIGSVTYPPPLKRKFPFAEEPIAVYEGETELKAILKADRSAQQGQRSISATLRIQACDDRVCYPPGSIDLQIPVTVK
jgi:DsbC/DsbD-like thiol-disulfide interchange protein